MENKLSEKEYLIILEEVLVKYCLKIESIKSLTRNGKYIPAHEKMTGVGDGLAYMVKSVRERLKELDNEIDTD